MRGWMRVAALIVGIGWQLASWASEPPVIAAVQQQDLQALSAALAAGAEVDATTTDHDVTALLIASAKGNLPAVRLLLAAGADVNYIDRLGWSALSFALHFRHDQVTYLLLEHGAKVNHAASPQAEAFLGTPLNVVIRADSTGNKDLSEPARFDWQQRMLRILLSYGVNLNQSGYNEYTALRICAQNNQGKLVSLLVAAGANPLAGQDGSGTPLMWAMKFGAGDAALSLPFTSSAINARDAHGRTALHWSTEPNEFASIDGRVTIVERLLEAGAEVDAVDNDGNSALHLAAINHIEEPQMHEAAIERLLLAHGADPFRPNHKGQTAAALAAASGHQTLVALIDQLKR